MNRALIIGSANQRSVLGAIFIDRNVGEWMLRWM